MAEIRFRFRGPNLVETVTATPDQRCVVNLHFSNCSRVQVKFQNLQLSKPDTYTTIAPTIGYQSALGEGEGGGELGALKS